MDNDRFPVNIPLYARVQYHDSQGNLSPWSAGVKITLGEPAGLSLIYSNDFESTPVDAIPNGWEVFTTTDDTGPQGSYYYPELRQWVVKDVAFLNTLLYYPSYGDPGVVETDLKIADGKTLVADSGDYVDAQNFFETHVITHEFSSPGLRISWWPSTATTSKTRTTSPCWNTPRTRGTVDITAFRNHRMARVGTWFRLCITWTGTGSFTMKRAR